MTAPKMLEYKAMPQLGYIPEKSLPVEVKTALDQINEKGEKLRVIYGDTNNDGKIDDKDTVNETYIMIQNLMDRHVPLAVTDYRRLHDLDVGDGARADTTKIKHSNVTGKEALLDVLRTINTQFDDLLNASYHQDGQKLLATNRYLQKRFNNPATTTDMQKLDSNVSSVRSTNTDIEIKAIENPTGTTGKNVSAENIKL
jgi:ABC-type Na+ efflux pump permease subunit